VAFGQPFVVAGAAAVRGDPGQGALDDPAAGQHLEAVRVVLATISSLIFKLAAQVASFSAYPASAQASRTWVQQRDRFHSRGRAASRSWTMRR
jgi:hypothetical protein